MERHSTVLDSLDIIESIDIFKYWRSVFNIQFLYLISALEWSGRVTSIIKINLPDHSSCL